MVPPYMVKTEEAPYTYTPRPSLCSESPKRVMTPPVISMSPASSGINRSFSPLLGVWTYLVKRCTPSSPLQSVSVKRTPFLTVIAFVPCVAVPLTAMLCPLRSSTVPSFGSHAALMTTSVVRYQLPALSGRLAASLHFVKMVSSQVCPPAPLQVLPLRRRCPSAYSRCPRRP